MKEKMFLSSEVNAQTARKKVSIGQSYMWIEIPKDFSFGLPADNDNFVISNVDPTFEFILIRVTAWWLKKFVLQ